MKMTALVVFTLFLVLGLWDFYVVYFRDGVASSVSRCLQRLGFKAPMFVFMMGLIMGHLFFAMEPECNEIPVEEVSSK